MRRPLAEPTPRTRLVLLHRRDRMPATVAALRGVVEQRWPEVDDR